MSCYQQLIDGIYTDNFYIIDDFLTEKQFFSLQEMAQQLIAEQRFKEAKIGHQATANINHRIRADKIFWLDENTQNIELTAFFTQLNLITQQLNRAFYLNLTEFEAHFALYPPGSFYKKHIDQFRNNQDRRISCVYYLNNNWHASYGGALTLFDKKNNILTSILPSANRFICFNSDLPHEVSPTTQARISIAAWLKTRAQEPSRLYNAQ